jgi:hypothetical protein
MSVAVRHGRLSQTNLVLGQLEPSPALAPPRPGRRKTGDGSLADEVALELRQGREDPEYQLAARCRGVDVGALAGEDTQPTLRSERPRTVVTRCLRSRPSRSSFHMYSVSPSRSALRQVSRPGRSSRLPEASSLYTWSAETPAAASASICRLSVCDPSALEIRAYPSFIVVSHTAVCVTAAKTAKGLPKVVSKSVS